MVLKAQEHCSFVVDETSTIEEFNWQATSFSIWLNRTQQEPLNFDLTSPFFWPYITDNIIPFNITALADKDFYEEDGWVAVYRNFGTPTSGVDNPGFVLYNRYEGILRVFIYLTETIKNYNTAAINASLLDDGKVVSKMSGLFSYIKGPVQALDNFDKNIEITIPNNWHNPQNGQWLHADIPIAYDPCTCNGHSLVENPIINRYGVLDISPTLTDVSTIDFVYGEKVTEKKKIIENSVFLPTYFKAGINKLDGAQKAGTKAFKGVEAFAHLSNMIVKTFEADSSKTKNNLNIKSAVSLIDNFKKYGAEVGAIVAIVDFLVVSSKNAAATTSNTVFSASDNFADQKSFDGLTMYLPGTQYPLGSSATTEAPIYKNILGVFGVLETPKIESAYDINVNWEALPVPYHKERIKLAEDIKYVVNPASKLNLDDIKGALYFPMKIDNFDSTFSHRDYEVITNLVPAYRAYVNDKKVTYYRTPYMPVSCLKDFIVTLDINFVGHDITSTSGVVPPFRERTIPMEKPILDIPTLQLITKLSTPSTIPDYREVNLITKYETSVKTLETIAAITGNNFLNVLVNPRIENLTLTQDKTIMAWEHIVVGDNINTNGHKLTIISGGSIDLDDFEFNPDIEMKIDYPIACDRIVLPQTAAEVAAFCQDNNKYKANFDKSYQKEVPSGREGDFAMLAYPNPFTQSSTIEFSLLEQNQNIVTLKLYDALGREVETIMEQVILPSGTYKRTTSSNLPLGIYFAVLQTDNGSQTIKLIKQ